MMKPMKQLFHNHSQIQVFLIIKNNYLKILVDKKKLINYFIYKNYLHNIFISFINGFNYNKLN